MPATEEKRKEYIKKLARYYKGRDVPLYVSQMEYKQPLPSIFDQLPAGTTLTDFQPALPAKQPQDIPIPSFPPEDLYANSKEFQNLLWRAKQFGLNSLTKGEQQQLQNGSESYPEVTDFINQIEESQAQAEKVPQQPSQQKEETLAPGEANRQLIGVIQKNIQTERDIDIKVAETKMLISALEHKGVPSFAAKMLPPLLAASESVINTLKDLAYKATVQTGPGYPAKGELTVQPREAPEPNMTMQLIAEALREDQTVGENLLSGIIQFLPYAIPLWGPTQFANDISNDPSILPKMAKQIGIAYLTAAKAGLLFDKESLDTMKKQPFEMAFSMALPALILLGIGKYIAPKGAPGAPPLKAIESIKSSVKDLPQGKVLGESLDKIWKAMESTTEAKVSAFEGMKPGELLSKALDMKDTHGYSARELVEIYSRNPEYIKYLASKGKEGIEPTLEPKVLPTTALEVQRATNRSISNAEAKRIAKENVRKNAKARKEAKKGFKKDVKQTALKEYLKTKHPEEKKAKVEPTVEKEAQPEVKLEPITAEEVSGQKKKVADLEKDVSERERIIGEIEDIGEGATSKIADVPGFVEELKNQLDKKLDALEDAKADLSEMQKRPIKEPEIEKKPELELKPVVKTSEKPVSEMSLKEFTDHIVEKAEKGEDTGIKYKEVTKDAGKALRDVRKMKDIYWKLLDCLK